MDTPYEYHDNKLGVKLKYLMSDRNKHSESLCIDNYRTLKRHMDNKNKCEQQLRAACFGQEALILFSSLDRSIKDALILKFGKPQEQIQKSWFSQNYTPDANAFNYYMAHTYGENNKKLDTKYIELYTHNASVLNTVLLMKTKRKEYRKAIGCMDQLEGGFDIWKSLSNDVNAFREVEHNLPTQKDALRRKANLYQKEGYISLISGKLTTKNAKIVTSKIESLIVSLYCLPTKPYVETVHELYHEFLEGKIEVVNIKTGELYERKNFFKNGQAVEISVATVWNYINAPHNILIIKKYRNGNYDFSHKNRPHVNRTAPKYSMSKISLDDRDIMHTKLPDGSKVMAYYAFDVLSTAMIGISHSKSKSHELFIDCLKNMFQFTSSKHIGMPLELEVEHHLVSDFKDGLMKAGEVFSFIRWCNATNSQEKYAEPMIKGKKYGVEKMNNQNVGRHYSRLDSNRTTNQKIFDEFNDTYKMAKASFEQIVSNELQEQMQYNNELHPNQKQYPGKTRLDVFFENINPNLPLFDKGFLAKYIGNKTETTIKRSQYVTVQYQKYQLESANVLSLLAPNNYKVDAYYITDNHGQIDEVFLYQKERFISKCKPVPTFNRATAEWTDNDRLGFTNATKYISQFDSLIKDKSTETIEKLTIFKTNNSFIDIMPEIIETNTEEHEFELEYTDYQNERNNAINDL